MEELLLKHRKSFRAKAVRFFKAHQEADDCLSSFMIDVISGKRKFPEATNPDAMIHQNFWFYMRTYRTKVTRRYETADFSDYFESSQDADHNTPERNFLFKEREELLKKLIEELSEGKKEVVKEVLKNADLYDTMRALKKKPETTKSLYFQGIQIMRKIACKRSLC